MDWCVKDCDQANHHPHAVINEDNSDVVLRLSAEPDDTITFDAAGSSDPDKDALRYFWWVYPEAGRRPYGKTFPLEGTDAERIALTIPADAAGKEIHLILEVWDESEIVPLVDYRRAIIEVNRAKAIAPMKPNR